jgi:hypothetical protein
MSLTALPNPMRESGSVTYTVPAGEFARIVLYDATGRQVKVLTEQGASSGEVAIPVGELASGQYKVRLESANGIVLDQTIIVQK